MDPNQQNDGNSGDSQDVQQPQPNAAPNPQPEATPPAPETIAPGSAPEPQTPPETPTPALQEEVTSAEVPAGNDQQPSMMPAPATTPSQQSANAETPVVAPAPPTAPAQNTTPQTQQPPTPPTGQQPIKSAKSKKKLLVVAIALLVVLTLAGIFLALKVFSGQSISLTTHESETFSLEYPEGYEQKERFGLTYFEETNDEDDDTHSGVIVTSEQIPADLSAAQKTLLRDQLNEFGDKFVDSIAGENQEIRNKESSSTELDGVPAERTVGQLFEDGKKVGDLYITISSNDDKYALVAVLAHVSDPGVSDKAQDIMNSFKFIDSN